MVKRYRIDDNVSYTLGVDVTLELLRYQVNFINKVYVHPLYSKNSKGFDKLTKLCLRYKVPIEESSKPFNILSFKDNPSVIGEFRKYYSQLNDKNHLVLVNAEDLSNLGIIIRTALGFGITDIAIISPSCDSFNPKVLTSSKGSRFACNIQYFENFGQYLKLYSHHDIYPFSHKSKTDLRNIQIDKSKSFSLVFGNEKDGLSDDVLACGKPILIKHSKNISSLDLPMAASIALYEFTKNNF